MQHLHILFSCLFFVLIFCCTSPSTQQEKHSPTTSQETKKEASSYVLFSNDKGGFDSIVNKFSTAYIAVQIYSLDSLLIDANYYHANDDATSILLCHQARWNKYEYDSTAVALQAKGYNCLAIDQRSGGIMGINGKNLGPINKTFIRASKAKLPTDYLDAEQDIIAAIRYLYKKNGNKPIILWGSSYSSTLALYNGIENDSVAAVISFSPGDYFSKEKGSLVGILKDTQKPFFITSSLEESAGLATLIKGKKLTEKQVQFIPKGEGFHGSRALWLSNQGNAEYWVAISSFLEQI